MALHRNHSAFWTALLLLVSGSASAAFGSETRAAPVVGPDFRVSGNGATESEFSPAVAGSDAADEFFVVWDDSRNQATRGSDIYGARFSATGQRLGPDRRISGNGATGDETTPAVVWNSHTGRYMVVWSDGRKETTRGRDVYGVLLSATGQRIGSDRRVSGAGATADEILPALSWAWTDTGEFLVVWSDLRNPGRGFDVFGRRLDTTGHPAGAEFRVSGNGAVAHEFSAAIAWSSAVDEYLVVWQDGRHAATRGDDIRGRRLAPSGARLGPDFRISGAGATADDAYPDVVASDASTEYLVVWQDARNYATRAEDVFGQKVSLAGARLGANFRVSGAGDTGAATDPAAAFVYDAARYLVVWGDDRDSATRNWDVYGRRVAG